MDVWQSGLSAQTTPLLEPIFLVIHIVIAFAIDLQNSISGAVIFDVANVFFFLKKNEKCTVIFGQFLKR